MSYFNDIFMGNWCIFNIFVRLRREMRREMDDKLRTERNNLKEALCKLSTL